MTDHREQKSSCPVTWNDEPRGCLTEWEATPMKPTEGAIQNDEAERLIAELRADAAMHEDLLPDRAADLIRTQAARIAELEAERDTAARDYCNLMDRHDAHFVAWQSAKARAEAAEAQIAEAKDYAETCNRLMRKAQGDHEAAEAALSEMTRRRDEWRKKAEGYDAVRLALREKVGTPWPPHMLRLLWAGIAADEKKRADDAESEVARLREALTVIAGDPEAKVESYRRALDLSREVARAALQPKQENV